MKEIIPHEDTRQAEASTWSRWRVEASREAEATQEVQSEDHYAWMNDCDRWMIAKPADKACWDYLERMIQTRSRNGRVMAEFYLASILPPPLNALLMGFVFMKTLLGRIL